MPKGIAAVNDNAVTLIVSRYPGYKLGEPATGARCLSGAKMAITVQRLDIKQQQQAPRVKQREAEMISTAVGVII